jgi:AMP-polyphosphate phosphotransferase
MVRSPDLSKAGYERLLGPLRDELLNAQFELLKSKASAVAIVLTGVPAAGRSESVGDLLAWMDPKFIEVHAYARKAPGAGTLPPMWRFWQDLPARGRIGLFFGAWYEEWVYGRSRRKLGHGDVRRRTAARIKELESMLVQEGVHVLKIHLHVPKDVQRKRLNKLASRALTRWRVTREDRWMAAHARRVDAAFTSCIKATSTVTVPWHRIDGSDVQGRSIAVGRLVLSALEQAAKGPPANSGSRQASPRPKVTPLRVQRADAQLPDPEYEEVLLTLQGRLARLSRKGRFLERGAVLVFEGMDAAGKGGTIRRLVQALDPRQYQIIPVSAPTPEERLYPYLWRFWRRLPRQGECAVFDRSWYGRVLVERVRGFAADHDWQRAYTEINEFENQLAESGLVICKFWLDVSSKVQLARFLERDANPLKRFKVDPEDWINRNHFAAYRRAAAEMVRMTDSQRAPWKVVDADDKHRARIEVLSAVASAIERAID